MNKKTISICFIACLLSTAVSTFSQQFAKGADISWLTEMEAAGKKFYSADGTQTECITLLKSMGMNAIRLRVWVNPTDGWCNAADLLVKARRANNLGMRIMVDFHYSDSWADPGKQTKPTEWATLNLTELKMAVTNHTKEVLTLLKDNNITPEWVQVGNETGNGMLWETGMASVSMANYALLTTAGYDAVKDIFPNTKVIVHIHNGFDNGLFRWMFDGLKNNGGKWDVIGMSLYPTWFSTPGDWQAANQACLNNMNDMVNRYNTEVMIVECGMSWDMANTAYNFLTDLIHKTQSVTNGMGTGLFYWEPQAYGNWKGYTLGAFQNNGRPTKAMDAFRNTTNTEKLEAEKLTMWYNKNSQNILFSEKLQSVSIINNSGQTILTCEHIDTLSTHIVAQGTYIVKAIQYSGKEINSKIVLY